MITTKTVFVLGAGASQPYGLPLGRELYQAVLDEFGTMSRLRLWVTNIAGIGSNEIDNFVGALRHSGLTSVDAFLEIRDQFIDIGKVLMAAELLKRENIDALWGMPNDWMQYLYGQMVTRKLEDFDKNSVSFITYNYDRTVEHFLFVSLKNTYGAKEEDCAKALASIPIIHLHGRLGYLHWQSSKDVVPFQAGGPLSLQTLEICKRQIRVVHEDIADREEDFKRAKQLLRDARRVYIMGFGYAPQNVERLSFEELMPEVYEGSAYGLTQQEMAVIRDRFQRKINLNNMNCLSLLRERGIWS